MTGRGLWLFVVVWVVALAAAGGARAVPVLLVLAGVAAAWMVGRATIGNLAAGSVVTAAWIVAIGPWRGTTRPAVGLVAACVAVALVSATARRSAPAAAAVAVVLVVASGFATTGVPTDGPPPGTSRLEAVDRYLRREVDHAQIPGVAISVVDDDRVVFQHGYGVAGDGEPMTAATPVVIGSTSKSITATAVLQLVEAGRVELDAPVRRYLPWFDPADPRGRDITVRQLLVDTSGIPTFAGWSALAGDGRADTAAIRELVNGVELTGAPGERFQYSNANYIIVGQVIEAVTGQPYAAYVQQAIFDPLGMNNTAADHLGTNATPNRYWSGIPVPSHLPYLEVGLPAGAISASAADLARYVQAHLDGGSAPGSTAILTSQSVDLAHRPAVAAEGFGVPPGRRYAMGWYVGTVADEPAIFHSGDVFDSSSSLVMLPERQLGVIVVATTSSPVTPVAKTLAEGVTALMVDKPAATLGRALATGTTGVMVVTGMVLAFSVVRARRQITQIPAGRTAVARTTTVDILLPTAMLVGLPMLFSEYLDRAENVDPISFWRLLTRALPDAGYVVLLALVLRLIVGSYSLTQAALAVSRSKRGTH